MPTLDATRALQSSQQIWDSEILPSLYEYIRIPNKSPAYEPNPDGSKKKYSPTNLAVASNGNIYVGDGYGSSYVNVYTSEGKYIKTFGGKGASPGQ